MDFWTDVRDWLGGWPMEFVSTSAMLSMIRAMGLRCVALYRNGGNTEFALTRPAGVARWTAGRVCEKLELGEFEEDLEGQIFSLQLEFYYWPSNSTSPRRWWFLPLPDWMREYSDGLANPQKNRLLLLNDLGDPFGYPTSHFARPDALRDLTLSFYAFWDGMVYISPQHQHDASDPRPRGVPMYMHESLWLEACLLPEAELSQTQEAEVYARARQAGLS